MTTDQLTALILPWAQTHHPEGYAHTVAAVVTPVLFRKCLLRLIYLRAETDKKWRNSLPLSLLHEAAITVTLRATDGTTYRVGPTSPITMAALALAPTRATLDAMQLAHSLFDLEPA